MKETVFYQQFVAFIQDIYDAENQIVKALPKIIEACTHDDLKKGLSNHLKETQEQVTRLQQVFSLLGQTPQAKHCAGMAGLIQEGEEILAKKGLKPAVKDCFIIIGSQKIEHYEMASYGSAIALVGHLEEVAEDKTPWKEICRLLESSLAEEEKADKTLTKVAEGTLFKKGVNEELESEMKMNV